MAKANASRATTAALHAVGQKADHHLNNCLETAGVLEAQLGLPLSIAELTAPQSGGVGSALPLSRTAAAAFDACSASYVTWFRERYAYYSGVQYAEERLCDGSRNGLIVGLVVGGINLLIIIIIGFKFAFCVIHSRPCFMCVSAVAPRLMRCLERCGCAPTRARKEEWQGMVGDAKPTDAEPEQQQI